MDTKIRKIFVLLYPLNDFSKRMYEYIQGKLAELAPAYAVVETGGVGYLLHISLQTDRKSTRLNSSHIEESRMPSSA